MSNLDWTHFSKGLKEDTELRASVSEQAFPENWKWDPKS